MDNPWLSIIGIGEDGLDGLSVASRKTLDHAEIVFGGPRHLALAQVGTRGQEWSVPFCIDPVLARRGQKVAVLASGDPFWYGAGGSMMAQLDRGEWVSYPAPSTFSQIASQLGWRLEEVFCFGLHAAPFARLLPVLGKGQRLICLLRDGSAPNALADWLTDQGAGASLCHIAEKVGGPNARLRATRADAFDLTDIAAPVAMAIEISASVGLPRTSGLPDEAFAHDGQITKRPIRALTLCALAPRQGEVLWDLGAGSGSISVEWCLAGGRAFAVEQHKDRVANITANVERFGLSQRMQVLAAQSQDVLAGLPPPDAVFIGGGGNNALLEQLFTLLPRGTRLVMNGVTLETEILLADWHSRKGGGLMRFEIATAAPLGKMRGWAPMRPVVQWSIIL